MWYEIPRAITIMQLIPSKYALLSFKSLEFYWTIGSSISILSGLNECKGTVHNNIESLFSLLWQAKWKLNSILKPVNTLYFFLIWACKLRLCYKHYIYNLRWIKNFKKSREPNIQYVKTPCNQIPHINMWQFSLSKPQCSVAHCIGWSISHGQSLHFVYSDLLILRILINNFVNSSMKELCHIYLWHN